MREVEVYVEICREGVTLPKYARPGDAGMDVVAAEDVTIKPGETVVIPTGIKIALPQGYEVQVRPRSGLSFKTPLRVANAPGTVDSGYRDEIGVIMYNSSTKLYSKIVMEGKCVCDIIYGDYDLTEKHHKHGNYKIKKGDRIAQIVLQEVPVISWTKIKDIKSIEGDRGGGMGSTGINSSGANGEGNTVVDKKGNIPRPSEKSPFKTKPVWCPFCGHWTKLTRKKTKCCGVSNREFSLRQENKGVIR